MTTGHWTSRLSEYLDNELSAPERAAADAHLRTCAACRGTLDELRAVTARAHALADRAPANDLWPAIAAAIGSEMSPLAPRRRPARGRRWSFSLPQLAAAALLLVTVSGAAVWSLAAGRPPAVATAPAAPAAGRPATTSAPGSSLPTTRFTTSRPTAEQSYDAAVADLQRVVEAGRGRLDEKTLQIVRKNLAAIDTAVAQARRAVEQDPANTYLNTYLARTMRRKIDLLRQVAALTAAES